ncbi:MAG TPA: hypothetical protein V6D50_05695 [Chroococcales cyanobacterium]|jgi:hypothetical protein
MLLRQSDDLRSPQVLPIVRQGIAPTDLSQRWLRSAERMLAIAEICLFTVQPTGTPTS